MVVKKHILIYYLERRNNNKNINNINKNINNKNVYIKSDFNIYNITVANTSRNIIIDISDINIVSRKTNNNIKNINRQIDKNKQNRVNKFNNKINSKNINIKINLNTINYTGNKNQDIFVCNIDRLDKIDKVNNEVNNK